MNPTAINELNPSARDHFVFDCEHLLKFCDRFYATASEDQNESVLEVKLKDLDTRWARVDASYEGVMLSKDNTLTPECKQEASEKIEVCTEAYYQCTSQIIELLKSIRLDTSNTPRFQSSSRYSMPLPASTQNYQDTSSNCIKLPPCDTEVFHGSYEQWPSFRDMFTAVYINHTKLSPVTKLYHLRNKTKGEAGAIVKRYPLSNDNFELAWDALKTRYENKRVLVDNQIKLLFDIPPATNEDSESIRRIQSSVNDSLATLKTLGIDVESWDPILIRLISTKLPELTLSLWEQSLMSPRELPKWTQMSQFLIDRYEAVERLTSIKNTKGSFNFTNPSKSKIQTYVSQESLLPSCKLCNDNHSLRTCPKFRSFTVQQRQDHVYKNKFCNNCLASSHLKANCKSKHTCLYCKKTHHTLLHIKNTWQHSPQVTESQITSEASSGSQTPLSKSLINTQNKSQIERPQSSKQVQANFSASHETILLRTALMQIEHMGELFTIRALIDPGSQRTFISEKIRNRLQLQYKRSHFEIIGIGGQRQSASKECEIVLYAKKYDIRVPIKAIVLPKLTRKLPSQNLEVPKISQITELELADPNFNKSSQIDLILGNDYEQFLNIEGIRKNVCGKASAYNTIFGWVLSGPMAIESIHAFTTSVVDSESPGLNDILRKFWEQEEIAKIPMKSEEDEYCESFYTQTTQRLENGRYIVKLPFKQDFPEKVFLGSSRFVALAQYARMEKTLAQNAELQSQYNGVLNEYLTLEHMEETSSHEIVDQGKYNSFYLPHHAVVRPEHKTTKVRVVFNASRKTKSQFSLNDILCTGPTLQRDLMTIILNWRKYQYVFSADIQKMYRQILIHPSDRPFQRILFQNEPNEPIKDYQLKTVTFGVNCAPYLAIRTLLQIASDIDSIYPRAASILRKETYVDDILSGGHSIEDALLAQSEIIQALKSAMMPLKKITANDTKLLSHLPKEDLYDEDFLRFQDASSTKTLGIKWNALTDSFTYTFSPIEKSEKITKRQILSAVAKLFDPAGWLAPIVIKAKILMQHLWLEGLEWDETVTPESLEKWNNLVQDIISVETIRIPRWIQFNPSDVVQIHGFSDASKTAYCATVYIRSQSQTHTVFSNLLVAKSKVAPIQTVSLPRLELSGAVLLAELVNYVSSSLDFNETKIFLWTDSSIVLGWLSKPPSTWETYVANRISRIHQLVPRADWRHVLTHDNPADLGTRGCKPTELASNALWWHGPNWLTRPANVWPNRNPLKPLQTNNIVQVLCSTTKNNDILQNFSSYSRALRVISYIFRFYNRVAKKCDNSSAFALTQHEVSFVKTRLVKLSQRQHYSEEYRQISDSQPISNKSSLKTLNPFLDSKSILRVNGRLSQSSLPYNERYPIILPGNSQFAQLYLTHLHTFLAHAECNQMSRMVQTEFYISRLKPRIKKIIRQCKTCIIYKHQPCSQIMAPLPPERCHLSPPFQVTGIDFAGPFDLKCSPLRKFTLTKGYACVFVCFSTKAIHLEACSELSSAAFQAAFSRFIGRRGLPQRVMSDNGRNFLGASRALLREFATFIKSAASDVSQKYVSHGFEWKFIPPHSPHMGGLWEAAVKSFKFHLKRTSGAQKFNFEEFSTILARIEGVLNSRPLSALSEDPTDLTALTPGHFLRGAPIMAFPEQTSQNLSLINRWEKLKALHHQFSLRWKEDYLKSLQKRYKWKTQVKNIQVGDLVVVMDDLQPPYEWRLGRVVKTFPGSDTNVRTAEVRIASGVIKRPIVKLCYLPFLKEQDSQ